MKMIKVQIVMLITAILLSGCLLLKDENKDIAKQQVVSFLDGYKEKDAAVSGLLVGDKAGNMTFEGVSAYFADKLVYEIKSCKKEDENYYRVETEIETIDFENLFTNSYQETIEKYGEEGVAENLLAVVEQNIKDKDYKVKKAVCNIAVMKLNGKFKIQMDSSLANALTGGMNQYLASLQGGE